jgi:hypothetical protein
MHFSIGFCARPKAGGTDAATDAPAADDGGNTATGAGGQGGAGGQAGAVTTQDAAAGATGTDASAGSTGTDASAGSTGTDASAGAAGADASAGTSGTDASAGTTGADASGDASSPCKSPPLNLPFAAVTNTDAGTPPDATTYGGGTPATGKYYWTSITHYGATAYSGSRQALYTIDAVAKTMQIATFQGVIDVTYTNSDAHTLVGSVVCDTVPNDTQTTITWYYTVTGGVITLYQVGASDVLTISLPAT